MDVNQIQQEQQAKQLEEMKRKLLTGILTKDAFERLARVRAVNPQASSQAELYLLNMMQSGKITEPITDAQLKDLLASMTEKKEFKVTRK